MSFSCNQTFSLCSQQDTNFGIMRLKEIYTFASAASHFNNPRFGFTRQAPRYIQHMEHYCNEYDMVGQWGVLHNTRMVLDNRYSGNVFVRAGATGHMLIQHYLDVMFPIPSSAPQVQYEHGAEEAAAGRVDESFLDKVVDVDETTANRRESTAARKLGIMRRDSGFEEFVHEEEEVVNNADDGRGLRVNDESRVRFGGLSGQAGSVGWTVGKEARGKTTRQLSRLWMYLDGGDPADGATRRGR